MTCDRSRVGGVCGPSSRQGSLGLRDPMVARGRRVRASLFGLTLICLYSAAILAADPGGSWYVAEEPGHFDYYWPGRSGRGWQGGEALRGTDGHYPSYPSAHPWERYPRGADGPAASRWSVPENGARRANLAPGDLHFQDRVWPRGDGRERYGRAGSDAGAYGQVPIDSHVHGRGAGAGEGVYPSFSPRSPAAPDYRFRPPEAAEGSYPTAAPRFGTDDYSEPPQSAYPRYRFRGDPEPGEGGWRIESGTSAFRFRPLSGQELERIQSFSGYRPLGAAGGSSFYRPQGSGDGWRSGGGIPGVAPGPWVER